MCSISKAEGLPKNFALLKIVKRTLDELEEKKREELEMKRHISIKYDKDGQDFVLDRVAKPNRSNRLVSILSKGSHHKGNN